MAQTRTRYYAINGGLDVVTPALSVDPGFALALVNYEPFYNGGYRRIDGYERFDGRPKPSQAFFYGFQVSSLAGLSTVGMTVTGQTSGASGVLVGTDAGTLTIGVTKVSGTFVNGETLVGGGTRTITSAPVRNDAPDQATENAWLLNAQTLYRADIQPVPGVGEVLGAWQRGDDIYALRDLDPSTFGAVLYRATATGWTTAGITMARYVFFRNASALPEEGETINGQTSGATATAHRVVLHGGAPATSDAYGYIVLLGLSGTLQNNENLRRGSTAFAVADGDSQAFTFPPGGHYQFLNHNFFGGARTYRTYGVNGEGPAFEIDEDNIVSPILLPKQAATGQPEDNAPFLLEEHLGHLFLVFPGGRFVHSVQGEPLQFNGFLGAAEFGIGAEITGIKSVVGGVLTIPTDRETYGLYGTSIADWQLTPLAEKAGARLFTTQKLDTIYALNDLGVTSLSRTQAFGNFASTTVSQLIQPIVQALREQWTDSTIVRSSNQYRLYFGDGSFLIMYVPALGQQNKPISAPVDVQFGYAQYPIPVLKVYNSEDADSLEVSYFASRDGFVYQDRVGTSFDGAEIPAYARLAFNNVGTPAYRKYFRRADLEINAVRPFDLKFVSDLSYGSTESSSSVADMTAANISALNVFAGGGFFDTSDWDNFYWDGQNISTARADLSGSGENIGFLVFSQSAIDPPHVLQGITLQFDLRRLQR